MNCERGFQAPCALFKVRNQVIWNQTQTIKYTIESFNVKGTWVYIIDDTFKTMLYMYSFLVFGFLLSSLTLWLNILLKLTVVPTHTGLLDILLQRLMSPFNQSRQLSLGRLMSPFNQSRQLSLGRLMTPFNQSRQLSLGRLKSPFNQSRQLSLGRHMSLCSNL